MATLNHATDERRRRDLKADLREGIGAGMYLAAAYSVIGGVAVALGAGRVIESLGANILIVVAAYFTGGLLSGVAFGLLRPMGATRLGAALLGFVVALPSVTVLSSLVIPPPEWRNLPVFSLGASALIGPILGIVRWRDTHP